jgi:hypothetical protein
VSYEQVKNLEPTEFKRLCGVTPATFEQMVKVVAAEKVLAKKRMRALFGFPDSEAHQAERQTSQVKH